LDKTLYPQGEAMTITTHVDEVDLPRRLLNITELADFLGVNTRHVRRLVAERRIPYLKVGRHLRISSADLEAFVAAGRVEANSL
jgi:excisionase family DNA binding protein